MKRLLSLFVAVAFVTGLAGVAAAQPTTTEKKPAEKMDKATDKMERKATTKTANGTVKSVSGDAIVVAGGGKDKAKEAEWTFAVDAKTKVKKAGKDAMASDVKEGDAVRVQYTEQDGKMVAQTVTVKPAKTEAKKAENPCAAKPAAKKQP